MSADALVQIRQLVKHYTRGKQTVEVLHGIDLDIPRGDFVALMGPSGSGKTTLLNLIGGLDTPTAGSVSVDGRRIDQLSGGDLAAWRAHNVGFVFQFYTLLPVLTAQKNVELPLLLAKMGGAERARRAQVALQLVGLGDRGSHKPSELSGGQEQRVAIARALVTDPTLLVSTGMRIGYYGNAAPAGWVRCNGRSLGSPSSGATERANTDCQALFLHLWTADATLAVSGGRATIFGTARSGPR